jgi:hypothetical protein
MCIEHYKREVPPLAGPDAFRLFLLPPSIEFIMQLSIIACHIEELVGKCQYFAGSSCPNIRNLE